MSSVCMCWFPWQSWTWTHSPHWQPTAGYQVYQVYWLPPQTWDITQYILSHIRKATHDSGAGVSTLWQVSEKNLEHGLDTSFHSWLKIIFAIKFSRHHHQKMTVKVPSHNQLFLSIMTSITVVCLIIWTLLGLFDDCSVSQYSPGPGIRGEEGGTLSISHLDCDQ